MIQVGLGTVQLGLPYGNRARAPLMPRSEAEAILELAVRRGIRFFDSAISYGESEKRLGDFGLSNSSPDVEISTKIPIASREIWSDAVGYAEFVRQAVSGSFARLGISRVRVLQFHQHDISFLRCSHVKDLMASLIDEDLCSSVGVSVYQPAEALAAMEIPAVSVLQVPINVIDRRFVAPGMTALYRSRNVRLLARSIFLQGVLIEKADPIPVKRQDELVRLKNRAIAAASSMGWSLHHFCLAFVFRTLAELLSVGILGADSVQSLQENLDILENPLLRHPSPRELEAFDDVSSQALDDGIADPTHWNT